MATQHTLWYFADPMCSWCWGFAPVITAIREAYADRVTCELVMGGLRPGTTEPVSAQFREEILHHWHEVNRRTGQSFAFDAAMPDGFVYDTEPPSRAVVSVGVIKPEAKFDYFQAVQAAFYTEQRDVTRPQTLAVLAQGQDVDATEFLALFNSPEVKQQTAMQFDQTAHMGIRGFPTVILQDQTGSALLTHGYRALDDLKPQVERWLTNNRKA